MFRLLSIAFLIGLVAGSDPAMAQPRSRLRLKLQPRPHARRARRRHPRSQHARLCHGERVAGRRQRSREGRRKLHPRSHPQPRAGDDRAGRRAAGNRLQLHHGIGRQQDLSRHRARAQHRLARRTPPIRPSSIVTTSHPAPYTRRVAVYVPKQYVPGTAAPFIVGADGPDPRCSRPWTI